MCTWNNGTPKQACEELCFVLPAAAAAAVYLTVTHTQTVYKTSTVAADAVEKALAQKSAFGYDPEPEPNSSVAPRPPISAGFIKVS